VYLKRIQYYGELIRFKKLLMTKAA